MVGVVRVLFASVCARVTYTAVSGPPGSGSVTVRSASAIVAESRMRLFVLVKLSVSVPLRTMAFPPEVFPITSVAASDPAPPADAAQVGTPEARVETSVSVPAASFVSELAESEKSRSPVAYVVWLVPPRISDQ